MVGASAPRGDRGLAGDAGGRRPFRSVTPRRTRPRGMVDACGRPAGGATGHRAARCWRRHRRRRPDAAACRTATATRPWLSRPARSPWASTSSGWLRASSVGWRASRTARRSAPCWPRSTTRQDLCATFYELWTLKEAFAKALRLPLVDALRQCRFVDAEFHRRADIPTTRHWRATVFAPRPQLRLAVARVADAPEHLDVPLGTLRVAAAAHLRLDRDPQPLGRWRLMRVLTCAASPA